MIYLQVKIFVQGTVIYLNKDICTRDLLKEIAYYEILPILREYYFDDLDKVSYWQDEFEGIFDNETK